MSLWWCIPNNSTSLFRWRFNFCFLLMPISIFCLPTLSFDWCFLFSILFHLQPIVLFSAISHMSRFILSLDSLLICYIPLERLVFIINWHGGSDIVYTILIKVCLDNVFPLLVSNQQGWWFDMVFHLSLTRINAQLQPERRKVLGGDWQIAAVQRLFINGSDVQVVHCCCRFNRFRLLFVSIQ